MDYDFSRLSAREFEHVAQALSITALGPRLTTFGDGPDGGREASWEGEAPSLGVFDRWDGYGIVQAKAKQRPNTLPAENLKWLQDQIRAEFHAWATAKTPRRSPEFYLLITNVRLSASDNAGKDSITEYLVNSASSEGIRLKEARVWDYDDLRVLLDHEEQVRNRYAAWLTPSDVIVHLLHELTEKNQKFEAALELHAASHLRAEAQLQLNQTGTVKDQPIGISQVFVDLPINDEQFFLESDEEPQATTAAAAIIEKSDRVPTHGSVDGRQRKVRKYVLVGGPGQGKSTVTQFIAQLYRSAYLAGSSLLTDDDLDHETQLVQSRALAIGLKTPRARRWVTRVLLPQLADALATGAATSLIDYLKQDINARAGAEVTASDLHGWLTKHPWLLLLDGFDEVPSSANREQLLAALSDFYAAVQVANGDVVSISTTRPQGYNEEFGAAEHIHLDDLDTETALAFAETFLHARNGRLAQQNHRTLELMSNSATEPSTQRLMTSPLQVTILVVLLERLGHAPNDRWRLFSAYYQVILQREQEKPGPLAKLLQEYSSEVDYIHRLCGFVLQTRASEAGGATSKLTRQELHQIILQRLTDQEFDESLAHDLADQFMKLATERLVFLAMLTSDSVGFEVRSFQEFMAAERIIVEGSEQQTMDEIRRIAPSAFWRNTLLFGIGRIFAQYETLKPFVVSVCTELDSNTEHAEPLNLGKLLALDILEDGVCRRQPRYARPLAQLASRVVHGPSHEDLPRLASLDDMVVRPIIKEEIGRARLGSDSDQIGAALFYAAENNATMVEQVYESGTEAVRNGILYAAWSSKNEVLTELARKVCAQHDLRSLVLYRMPVDFMAEDAQVDSHWDALKQALRYRSLPMFELRLKSAFTDSSRIALLGSRIESNTYPWTKLRSANSEAGGWPLVRALAEFVCQPEPRSLAELLRAMASEGDFNLGGLQLPWIALWLLGMCQQSASAEDATLSAGLLQIASEVEAGKYGDAKAWIDFEREVEAIAAFDPEETLPAPSSLSWTPTVLEFIKTSEFRLALQGFDFDDDEGIEARVRRLLAGLEGLRDAPMNLQRETRELILLLELAFVQGLPRRNETRSPDAGSVSSLLQPSVLSLADATARWCGRTIGTFIADWTSRVDVAVLADTVPVSNLLTIGESLLNQGAPHIPIAMALLRAYRVGGNDDALELALRISPWLAADLTDGERFHVAANAAFEKVRWIVPIVNASPEQVSAGDLDNELAIAMNSRDGNLRLGTSLERFAQALATAGTFEAGAIAARAAIVTYPLDTRGAARFIGVARECFASAPGSELSIN